MRSGIRAEDKEFILWVGRCMDTKHPMKFIELAQKLPEKEFVMIMPINKEIPEAEKSIDRNWHITLMRRQKVLRILN